MSTNNEGAKTHDIDQILEQVAKRIINDSKDNVLNQKKIYPPQYLEVRKINESELIMITEKIKVLWNDEGVINKEKRKNTIRSLLTYLEAENLKVNADWNIGRILQHLDPYNLIKLLEENKEWKKINKSIGLAYCLGEINITDTSINYLNKILDLNNYILNTKEWENVKDNEDKRQDFLTSSSEAWWRAAHSLEKLTGVNAINLLKTSLKSICCSKCIGSNDTTKDKCSAFKTDFICIGLPESLKFLNKFKVIGVLIKCNPQEIERIKIAIIECIKQYDEKKFYENKEANENEKAKQDNRYMNAVWLLCRFGFNNEQLFLNHIEKKCRFLDEKDHENERKNNIKYYLIQALTHYPQKIYENMFFEILESNSNILDRRNVAKAFGDIQQSTSVSRLKNFIKEMLMVPCDKMIIKNVSESIYKIQNSFLKQQTYLKNRYISIENGILGEESLNSIHDALIYNIRSRNIDPDNICLNFVLKFLGTNELKNPIDLGTGTGNNLINLHKYLKNYNKLIGIEIDDKMIEFTKAQTTRMKMNPTVIKKIGIGYERIYKDGNEKKEKFSNLKRNVELEDNVVLLKGNFNDFNINGFSNLIISSFNLRDTMKTTINSIKPDQTMKKNDVENEKENEKKYESDKNLVIEMIVTELSYIEKTLIDDNSYYITIGFDETFEDEYHEFCYRYLPDNIRARSFSDWIEKKKNQTVLKESFLTYAIKNISIPIIFASVDEAVYVMGNLLGRDVVPEIIKTNKTIWWMSIGITIDNKKSLKDKIKMLKSNNHFLEKIETFCSNTIGSIKENYNELFNS